MSNGVGMGWFFSGLLTSLASLAPVAQDAPPAAPAAPAAAVVDRNQAALEAIRAQQKVPALGAALFTTDRLERVYVTGRRAADQDVAVELDDAWHLGSCTKSMTATLIALLVERGDLAWETPLSKLLPKMASKMHADYKALTLVELLAHRAGIAAMTGGDATLDRCAALSGSATEQRREFTRAILSSPPASKPLRLVYSNAGIMIAGYVAEVATGKSWEELMQTLLFDPLGMASAGFGPPGFPDELAQPRGHDEAGQPIEPGPDADNPPIVGPAGVVHASLADWAKYLQLHLRGVNGDVKVGKVTLSKATFARLHTPYPKQPGDDEGAEYGYGWSLPKRDWAAGDHTVLTHTGSNSLWFCCCWLDPAGGFGVIATTNGGIARGSEACDGAVGLLLQERLAAAAASDKR